MNGEIVGPFPSSNQVLRSKNKKKDEAIRKRVEQELTKRKTRIPTNKQKKNTVSSLKPNPAILILDSVKIIQACQLMAAKRTDAVLAVDSEGELVGILTDKDIAFRVVAEGLSVQHTLVRDVMTPKPMTVFDQGSRNEALSIMISRKFRHLPVIHDSDDDGGRSVVGLLDITKCVFERLEDLERKVNEDRSIISAMEVLERRGTVNADKVDNVRNEHECPDIASLKLPNPFPSVPVRSSVRDAALSMKKFHSTAVLVTGTPDGEDKVGGIFTTKDIVLRVIAGSLDPNVTSVIRVMTPHPDFVSSTASILDALKKLHSGHFLHLPVIDNSVPKGLVDVMTLTVAMLTYLMNKTSTSVGDGLEEGPAWNSFWNSTFAPAPNMESDRLSQVSFGSRNGFSIASRRDSHILEPSEPAPSLITPDLSASQNFTSITEEFSVKLKDMTIENGKIYRFRVNSKDFKSLYDKVLRSTGYSSNYIGEDGELTNDLDIISKSGQCARLCYVDDEGDTVSIESDIDLEEAVSMCIAATGKRLMIYLGTPPEMSLPTTRSTSPSAVNEVLDAKSAGLFDILKETPVVVNVAISASIVVMAFYVMKKISE